MGFRGKVASKTLVFQAYKQRYLEKYYSLIFQSTVPKVMSKITWNQFFWQMQHGLVFHCETGLSCCGIFCVCFGGGVVSFAFKKLFPFQAAAAEQDGVPPSSKTWTGIVVQGNTRS